MRLEKKLTGATSTPIPASHRRQRLSRKAEGVAIGVSDENRAEDGVEQLDRQNEDE